MPLDPPATLDWLRSRIPEHARDVAPDVATAEIVTGEGYPVWFTRPECTLVTAPDVVATLTRVCRYAGARPWSVAQHSLLCVVLFDCFCGTPDDWEHIRITSRIPAETTLDELRDLRRSLAMHDGAEYVLGDPPTRLKSHLGSTYKQLEYIWRHWINLSLQIPNYPEASWQRILEKEIDRAALVIEAYMLDHRGYPVILAHTGFSSDFVPDQLAQNLFRAVLGLPTHKLGDRLLRVVRGKG